MIEAALVSILKADSAVTALVGTRIYPVQLPLNCTFPAISYFNVSDPFQRITGYPRIQISCWAKDYAQVLNLKSAVETTLNGYSGIVNGVNIEMIAPLSAEDYYDSDTGIYHIPYDFKIIYRR